MKRVAILFAALGVGCISASPAAEKVRITSNARRDPEGVACATGSAVR